MPYTEYNNANLYYEVAGNGRPFVMTHAGVCDHRQWNNEFRVFSKLFRAVRWDMRGFGNSELVAGAYRSIDDLLAVLDAAAVDNDLIMMGCSMGGTLSMDFTLAYPERVAALIMVGSGPSRLQLDVKRPAKFAEVEKAEEEGDLQRVCELETQIWFDGAGRTPLQVNQAMRRLAYDMNMKALAYQQNALEQKVLADKQIDLDPAAAGRLQEIKVPVLVIVGEHDLDYMHKAASFMQSNLDDCRVHVMKDAAHLPNMDHPALFQETVSRFLEDCGVGIDKASPAPPRAQ